MHEGDEWDEVRVSHPEGNEFLVKLLISRYNNISQFTEINLMRLFSHGPMKLDDDNTNIDEL